jgi:hypothetical protein
MHLETNQPDLHGEVLGAPLARAAVRRSMPLRVNERAYSVVRVCSDSALLGLVALPLTRTRMARGEPETSAVRKANPATHGWEVARKSAAGFLKYSDLDASYARLGEKGLENGKWER